VIAGRVEGRIASLLDREQCRWVELDPDLAPVFDATRALVLGGGKRLRPAFSYWAFVGAGGDPDHPFAIGGGAAIELLHAFALFHDDVMDGALSRRGNPTVHQVYEQRHRDGSWAGEPRRFGEGAAILIGDLSFVYADMLLDGAPPEALHIWHELRLELNMGQYLDILGSARRERREEVARRICRYKSGKYTVERPLHLGATLAAPARSPELVAALSAYGLPLGDAFQMRDDVLGVFGDTERTGKPVGDDLREGKPTPLLALTTARADSTQRALLGRVGAPDITDDDVAAIQAVIVDTGALAELEARIERLADEARAALASLPVTDAARQELGDLVEYIVRRDV
jgi:geranylgeranyl diphosphate synthase type I